MTKRRVDRHKPRRCQADRLPHYDFRDGARGKHAAQYSEGGHIVMLAPDVAALYPDSASVNDALRTLDQVARLAQRPRPARR